MHFTFCRTMLVLVAFVFSLPHAHASKADSLATRYKDGAEWALKELQKIGIENFGDDENRIPIQDLLRALQQNEIKYVVSSEFSSPFGYTRQSAYYSFQEKTVFINKWVDPKQDVLPYFSLHETLGAFGLAESDYQLSIAAYFYLQPRARLESDEAFRWRKSLTRELLYSHAARLIRISLDDGNVPGYRVNGGSLVGGGGDADAMIFKIRMMESFLKDPVFRNPEVIYSFGPWIQIEFYTSSSFDQPDDPFFSRPQYGKSASPIPMAPGGLGKIFPANVRPQIFVPRSLAENVLVGSRPEEDPTMRDILFFLQSFFWLQTNRPADFKYSCDGRRHYARNPRLIHPDGFRLFEKDVWQEEVRLLEGCIQQGGIGRGSIQ